LGEKGDGWAEGFYEEDYKWNWFTANELNATLEMVTVFCVCHRHKPAGGNQMSLLYSRQISQTFPGSNQNGLIIFVLWPVEKDSHAIYCIKFKGFYFFLLVVAIVSTKKRGAAALHKSKTD
jgi:hypothetical protein